MLIYAGARVEAVDAQRQLHAAAPRGARRASLSVVQGAARRWRERQREDDRRAARRRCISPPRRGTPTSIERAARQERRRSTRANGAWSETPLMWAAAYNRVDAMQALRQARREHQRRVEGRGHAGARDARIVPRAALRNRRVAALKAAEQPPRPAGAAPNAPRDSSAARDGAPTDSAAARASRTTRDSTAGKASYPKDSAAMKGAAQPLVTNGRPSAPGAPAGANPPGGRPAQSDSARQADRGVVVRRARRQQGRPHAAAVRGSAGERRSRDGAARGGRERSTR